MLTGQLPFILMAAAVLAYPISILLLRLYRRAMLRSMARRAGAAAGPLQAEDTPEPAGHEPTAPLRIVSLPEPDSLPLEPKATAYCNQAIGAPWRAAAVYSLGGLGYAVIMAAAFLLSSNIPFLFIRFLMLALNFIWPLVLTICLVAGSTSRTKIISVITYFGVYVLIGTLALMRSSELSVVQHFILWGVLNVPPTALVLAFFTRRVRAVGPMVLTFLIIAITGSVVLLEILGRNQSLLQSLGGFGFSLGLGATGVFISFILMGFAALGVVGWFIVRWIRTRYERKSVSDQSLTLDTVWLLFGIVQSIGPSFEGAAWILSGLVAFLAYKGAVWLGFSVIKGPLVGPGARLLLLRVFSLGKRSEWLFDAFGTHWRYVGSVQMIAGPDLATTTVEPHEFLDFLTGKLSRRFIDSRETFNRRLAERDLQPDHDWRFRVNDFFCFDDTWKMVLTKLVSESDTVLMDLRGFSRERAGCIFEINELINSASLDQMVFLVDSSTDQPFLRRTVEQTWQGLRSTSPNYQAPSPQLRLFQYQEADSRSLHQLLSTTCAAVRPEQLTMTAT
jgi:hypothetical protein